MTPPRNLTELVLSRLTPQDARYIRRHPLGKVALVLIRVGGLLSCTDLIINGPWIAHAVITPAGANT